MISTALKVLSARYLEALGDMVGLEILPLERQLSQGGQFRPLNCMLATLDITGTINGFFAVQAEEIDIALLAGLDRLAQPEFRDRQRLEYEDLMTESLNAVSGECMEILRGNYPAISVLVPKVIYGSVSFPNVPYYSACVRSTAGTFTFTICIDTMEMDVSRFITESLARQKHLEYMVKRLERSLEDNRATNRRREVAVRRVGKALEVPADTLKLLLERLDKIGSTGEAQNREVYEELRETVVEFMDLAVSLGASSHSVLKPGTVASR